MAREGTGRQSLEEGKKGRDSGTGLCSSLLGRSKAVERNQVTFMHKRV